jgi:hypothetical protein
MVSPKREHGNQNVRAIVQTDQDALTTRLLCLGLTDGDLWLWVMRTRAVRDPSEERHLITKAGPRLLRCCVFTGVLFDPIRT